MTMTNNTIYNHNPVKSMDYNNVNSSINPAKKAIGTTLFFVVAAITLSSSADDELSSKYKPISTKLENQSIYSKSRLDLKLVSEVRKKGQYKNNWDGNGAIPPSNKAITEAENFIRLLANSNKIMPPIVSAASDGELNFLWKLENFELDLGFYGDNTYSYYGILKDGHEYMSDSTPSEELLPKEIIKLISNSYQA